jgi:hypothetical protein
VTLLPGRKPQVIVHQVPPVVELDTQFLGKVLFKYTSRKQGNSVKRFHA